MVTTTWEKDTGKTSRFLAALSQVLGTPPVQQQGFSLGVFQHFDEECAACCLIENGLAIGGAPRVLRSSVPDCYTGTFLGCRELRETDLCLGETQELSLSCR